MSISAQLNQLDFEDGTTLILSIIRYGAEANNREADTSDIQQILQLMPMELAHIKLGRRPIRSFMDGSLHQVWSDCKLSPKTDEFCEGSKIATSRSADRQHIGTPTPSMPF
eukprot:4593246-Ditylum_brightwellii.AAC.1